MKKLVIAAVCAAIGSASAFAADLPMQTYKSPPVVAQVYNWTGMYIGVNGGYGWGNQDPLNLISGQFDRSSFGISGGMVGGTVGAQIQQGYVVLGFEGDLDWANITGSKTIVPTIAGLPIGGGLTLNMTTNTSAVGTARARFGAALDNWLLYGTGGVAFDKSSASATSIAGVPCGTLGVIPNCSGSSWKPGLAAGLGAEWGFAHNWTAKAEYIYVKVISTAASTDSINTFRFGVNYLFH